MTTLEQWEAEQMEDPAFRAACAKQEPLYQRARARYYGVKYADYIAEQRKDPEYRKAERQLWLVLLIEDFLFRLRQWWRRFSQGE